MAPVPADLGEGAVNTAARESAPDTVEEDPNMADLRAKAQRTWGHEDRLVGRARATLESGESATDPRVYPSIC
jgi:hypothetical protein